MPKTKDVKPYVERAIKDEEFRDNLKSAFVAARDIYDELMGPRGRPCRSRPAAPSARRRRRALR